MVRWRTWAVCITALLLLIVVISGVWQFWLLQSSLERQRKLVSVALAEHDSLLQLVNEETGVRGLVATGDRRFLEIYYESLPKEAVDAGEISRNLEALPDVRSDLRDAQTLASQVHRFFEREIALTQSGSLSNARERLGQGKVQFDRLRAAEAVMARQADDELEAQRSHTRLLARAGFVVGLVVCGVLVLSAIAFVVLVQRASRYRMSSMRDSLTGATNRRGAMAAIEALISASSERPFGLVFIDLDGFKKVNDAYGHAAGDAILKEVAARLRSELRNADEVCRLGGDEFVCVIAAPESTDHLLSIAARLRKAVAQPFAYDNDVYAVGCSVGVSMYPQHGSSIDVLLKRADRAMYDAKAAGGGVRG